MRYFCLLTQLLSLLLYHCNAKNKADSLINIANKEIGINKYENPKRILEYLKTVKIYSYSSWCAAFVRWCLDQAKLIFPIRSGLAQKYILTTSINAKEVLRKNKRIPKGSLVIWKKGNTWQGHIGFVAEEWYGVQGKTIEGNTSSKNMRSGGYVEKKMRSIAPLNSLRITHFTLLP